MPTIRVNIPSRNQTIEFDEGTPESVIQEVIKRDFPRNGSDVAYEVNDDPTFSKSISNEDFELYEGFLDKKKTDFLGTAASAAGYIASTVGTGIKGLFEARNLNPEVAAATAIESGAQGTRDLYGMLAQSEDPSSMFFKFKDWINGTGTVEDRKKQWLEARDFSENTRKMEAGQQTVTGINPALVNNDVKNALKLIADPTFIAPGIGEVLGAGKLGARVTGAAMEAAGRTAQAVTRPLVDIVDASTRMAGEAFGANANAIKGLAAGSGVTGVVMGVPGVREAAMAVGTVEGVNKAGQVLETAGQALGRTPTRIGALESLALNPNASAVDRALAKVGRYGGDDLIDIGARSAAGAVEGAAIGTTLGYLSAGEEGAAGGFGTGGLLGGAGAGAARLYGKASGAAAIENRHGDFKRFYETLDPETQAKFDTIVKRSGLDGASQVMDVSGIIRGKFNDVDINYLEPKEFIEKHGSNARGAEKVDGERPVIDINIGSFDTQRTVGHELFHAFKAIDQLRPLAERVESMIVGNYIIDGNGQSVKTSSGILSETDTIKKFDEYLSKFKGADGNVNLPPDSPWIKANTVFEKTKLVGEELGAEYMSRMITGSNTDAMFRGFDGITRTILDNALLNNTEGFMRRTAQSIGLGSKPIESLIFAKLENASPALNAALRDMVRARRNMTKKIELAEGTGYVLTRLDIANAAAFEQMKKLGIAETDKNGSPVMRSDDVITQEDRGSLAEIKKIIMSAPVSDANEPRLRDLDGKIVGDGISAAQIDAIMASPLVIDKVKESFTHIKNAMDNGNVIRTKYGKALKKVKNWISGKKVNRYNDGVRMTGSRDILPYEIKENKAGELYFNGFDLTKARNAAMDLASKGELGPWGQDFQLFYGDLVRYANNLSDQVHQVPTKELFGDANAAAFMTDFFGGKDGTDSKFIRSFTLDRLVEILPTDEKVAMTLRAYKLNQARFMPAENIGDGKVFNSPDSGFTIISKNAGKYSLYAPTGERVGIYDTQARAEAKANFESKSIKNAPHGISPIDPAQAKSILDGSTQHLNDGNLLATVNFMPDSPEVKRLMREFPLDEEAKKKMQGKTGFAFVSDWADSNRKYVTESGREVDVMKGGMGYTYLPEVIGKGAWAGTFSALTDRVVKKINASDGIGLVVLGGEESSASSRSFSLAFAAEIQDAIASKQLKRKDVDRLIAKAFYSLDRPEIKTLEDYAALIPKERNAENPGGLTFEQRDLAVREIGSAANSRALGVPNWNDILRKYRVQKGDYKPGQIVSVVQFEKGKPAVRSQVAGTANHPSYEAVLLGKPIGVLTQKVMIADFFKDFFASEGTKPASFTRKVQTKMPEFKYGEGSSVLEGRPMTDVNFMPAEQAAPESKFYSSRIISAVENSSQGKANGSQWKATIKNSKFGVNQDEYALTRVEDLEPGKTYTKAEVLDYLRANEVVVKDVTLGGAEYKKQNLNALDQEARRTGDFTLHDQALLQELGNGTHFSQYTLPGAKEGSYREVLLTTETTNKVGGHNYETGKKVYRDIGWRDGHYQYADIPNPIVRLRTNERTTADGKRMLFLEEVQAPQKDEFEKMPALFQKNWRDIAFKWSLRTAADNGFDSVGWTTGEQQAARYDLSKHIKEVDYIKRGDKYEIAYTDNNGGGHNPGTFSAADLSEVVGKEVAQKIVDGKGKSYRGRESKTLEGLDLKIGGEGLKKLYDQDFHNVVNNLPIVKKSGQRVRTELVDTGELVHAINVNPDMRNASVNFMPETRVSGQQGSDTTQIATTVKTYGKAAGLFPKNTRILDVGAGLGLGADEMRKNGHSVDTVEPLSARWSSSTPRTFETIDQVTEKYPGIVNFSVLNVVEPKLRDQIVDGIGQRLADGGTAYITARTRSDVEGAKNKRPANEAGGYWIKKSGGDVYQKGFSTPELVGYVQTRLGDQFNVKPASGLSGAAIVITKFMPAMQFSAPENLPNGKVWRGENGYVIMQKEGGKFRVHSPIGLIGIASSYEAAEKMASKRNNK